MLLESALAELSIYILDDNHPQSPAVAAAQSAYNSPEIEICESSSDLLESSSKPITRHEEKEEFQSGSSTRTMMHMLEDQEKYNWYREPQEIHPGVPMLSQRESELIRFVDEDQSSPVPLKFPPTASRPSAATSASPKNAGACFNWNFSHLSPQSINVCEGSVQGGNYINGYEGDDDEEDITIPSKLELDSNEEWSSPVSTLELPQSPGANYSNSSRSFDDSHDTMQPSGLARSAGTTLLSALFPCKCIFLPSSKNHKGKKKKQQQQREWPATGHQAGEDSKVNFTSPHEGPKMIDASQPVRPISALKKKISRSGSSNRNYCESATGMKQVRFSVETDAYFSPSNGGGGGETVPPPTQMDWASYGLF